MKKQILSDIEAFIFGVKYAAKVYIQIKRKKDKKKIKQEIKEIANEAMETNDIFDLVSKLLKFYVPTQSQYIILSWINPIKRQRILFLKGFLSVFEVV